MVAQDELCEAKSQEDREHHADRGGAGDSQKALVGKAHDIDGCQIPLGRDQEDNGAERIHRPHEGIDEAHGKRVFEHRNDDFPKGRQAVRAEVRRGLFQRFLDLREAGHRLPVAHRELAERHAHDHDDEGAGHFQRPGIERHNQRETDKRARQRDRQHGEKIHDRPPREAAAQREERQRDAKESRDNGGRHGSHPAVLQRGGLQDALDEIVHRKGVVKAEGARKREQADDADNQEDGKGDEAAEREQHPAHRRAHRDPLQPRDGLSGDGDIGIFFQIIALDEKDDQRRDDEEHGKDRAHRKIPRADHLRVCLRCQHMIIRAHQHRVAEVGEAVDGDEEERAGEAGRRQPQRDRAEKVEAPRAEVLRRQLQIRADGLQDARDRDIRQREKGDGLHHPKAEPAVKVNFQIQQIVSDEAAPPEQHDKREARNHRGRHGREQRHDLKEPAPRQDGVIHRVGVEKAQHHCGRRGQKGREKRVGKSLLELPARNRQRPVQRRRHENQLDKRINDKDREHQKKQPYGEQKLWLATERAKLRGPARLLMADRSSLHNTTS